MAYTGQNNQLRVWDTLGEIFSVFALDEFIVFAVRNGYRHADFGELARGLVGFGLLHEADGFGKRLELVWRGR